MNDYDVIILGAGASGLICAIESAARGRRVVVLDHAKSAGRKIRVSGGGKCNFTNLHLTPEDFVCSNPHFVKSALARYSPWEFIALLDEHSIPYQDMGDGRMFCTTSANDIVDMLRRKALSLGVDLKLSTEVLRVKKRQDVFQVETPQEYFEGLSVVVATGGPAWPQIGATSIGHDIAKSFGIPSIPLRPGLAPFVAPKQLRSFCRDLTGISLPVTITNRAHAAPVCAGPLLFTHKGISGLAVLDASTFWSKGQSLSIDLLPGQEVMSAFQEAPRQEIKTVLSRFFPKRLAVALCTLFNWNKAVNSYSEQALRNIEIALHSFAFTPSGTEGFEKAEATLGGVNTDHISSKTMEAKSVPGLFFTGEVLDVTGRLGGYNLHWAWASGHAAGQCA